ncbi:MAG: hypothetical protein EZS28_041641 [Streblomastix strix]|uniref:Uncharacterized protein n=1 Tax=Streblomastix strix TaxID=222440 RepID=A0A5J4TY37_9EUKA|nr:MAG: hypothetical protein EZS28_041641 [Streblomastix strix]
MDYFQQRCNLLRKRSELHLCLLDSGRLWAHFFLVLSLSVYCYSFPSPLVETLFGQVVAPSFKFFFFFFFRAGLPCTGGLRWSSLLFRRRLYVLSDHASPPPEKVSSLFVYWTLCVERTRQCGSWVQQKCVVNYQSRKRSRWAKTLLLEKVPSCLVYDWINPTPLLPQSRTQTRLHSPL